MSDIAGAEHSLYLHRPDLWGITRALKHCKGGAYDGAVRQLWEALSPQDQDIIRQASKGVPCPPVDRAA